MTRTDQGSRPMRWLRRVPLIFQLLGRFIVELVIANLEQARLVLGFPLRVRPRWIEYRTRLRSETTRTLLGSLISLTPGTLTCDLEGDVLTIHALNATSDEEAVGRIREKFESLLIRLEDT